MVNSEAERPTRTPREFAVAPNAAPLMVKATCPRPAPCTVTDANPDVTTLLRDTALRLPTSAEYASDMLPDCSPTVMMARFVFARILMLVKHMIAVLDDHPVPSQPVAPSRPTVLMSTVASPSPYTVTRALPVAFVAFKLG